jgi:hypothetical protein
MSGPGRAIQPGRRRRRQQMSLLIVEVLDAVLDAAQEV